ADSNGDGIVDINDTLAISLNYNQTHTFRQQNPAVDPLTAPMLYLDPVMDTVGALSFAYVDIYLANAAMPVNDLYGISFTITYDNALVQSGSAQTTFNGSFVGVKNSTMIAMAHDNSATGENDIALCRLTHTEVDGYGYVGTLRITTAGVTSLSTLNLEISNVKAMNGQMVNIPIAAMGAPVVIDPAAGITNPVAPNHIGLYPNPAKESLVITTNAAETIEITNALGQVVYTTTATGTTTTIDVREFEAGVYFVSVYSEGTKNTERLVIE
ncbi:MAG TPA: T9SS type A sorting domain-containing protein, partial [Bacteroidia bacterium]|nr:T9SS type A sorting domain-containing protein [Bacteroidia bacterium]